MGHRSWFTQIDSITEFTSLLSALDRQSKSYFGYSDIAYILKVDNTTGPFSSPVVVAWSSDGDMEIKKLPFLLRQQTELLDSVLRRYPDLNSDKSWPEKYGTLYDGSPESDAFNEITDGLPIIAEINGWQKTEKNFIQKMYDDNYIDPSMLETANHKVFISHSHEDKALVKNIAKDLNKYGIDSWIDESEIKAGESLIWKIGTAIKELHYVIAVISESSIKSNWVKKELSMAMTIEINEGSFRVIPIVIDNCEVPVFLMDKLYIDFSKEDSYNEGVKKIVNSIHPTGLLADMIREILPEDARPLKVNYTLTDEEMQKSKEKL